jgi:hypothetical protein
VTPFRLKVLRQLTDVLKGITPDNGYETDLSDYLDTAGRFGERVVRGRDRFSESDGMPLVSVLEDFRANNFGHGGDGSLAAKGEWKLLVQGFVKDDPVHRTDPAYVVAADVVKALIVARSDKYNLLGLGGVMPCVSEMKMEQPVVRPADGEISSTAYFFLSVTLTLVEDLENPFVA